MAWGAKNATKKQLANKIEDESADREDSRRQEDTSDTETELPELGTRTRVKVKDVIDPKSDRVFDEDHVLDLAERLKVEGQIYPILVRMVKVKRGMFRLRRTVLVDGAHRLRAKRRIGDEYIDCMYVQGDNIEVELMEIGANFSRKQTVLVRAKNLVRWMAWPK
jgi:ParB-like nuclease domain